MIYLVSKNSQLFSPINYKIASFKDSLKYLNNLKQVQLDTETMGLDCHTKELLTVQIGNKENQYVFDWSTLTKEEKSRLKSFLESDILLIGHNLMFDLTFLYKQDIWPIHIYDTMIAEQLIYLGYPKVLTTELFYELNINLPFYELIIPEDRKKKSYYELSYALNKVAKRRLGIDIDKTVRGKIINEGLTEEVVLYAGGDVMWLEDIMESQKKDIEEQNLSKAVEFECEFIKSLAYVKYCGVHLDPNKWKAKMDSDQAKLNQAKKELDEWVINWDVNRKYSFVDNQGDLFSGFNTEPQCSINWSSSAQVVKLFEDIGVKVETFDKKTRKKKKSVEEKQISPQAKDFPIIPIFLRYQEAAKVVSTYGQNWLNAINPVTGRIHVELHSIGTDTCRVSSGGGVYKLNQQNLPHDPITRACFTAEKGNKWLSADYSGQESCITASVANDSKMIEILSTGGDLHSEVAKSCWPELLKGLTDKEVKEQFKSYRQDAKGVEFGIFYGGDDNTLRVNKGFSPEEAKRIYDNFMSEFSGIKTYQDACRKDVMQKGYILMNTVLRHRAHIFDAEWLFKIQEMFKEDGFWQYYNDMKKEDPYCETVQSIKKYFKRKSDSERQAINYRIQNRGACAFKLAMIKFFRWIIANNYQNIIKICVVAHDEINVEAPETIAEEVGKILVKAMEEGGKPFCTRVFLGADISIGDHWIH